MGINDAGSDQEPQEKPRLSGSWLVKIGLPLAILAAAMILYPHYYSFNGMVLPSSVSEHPLFAVYQEHFDYRAVMGGVQDLNGDGEEDLLVIYSLNRQQNQMVIILAGDPPYFTTPEPAPLENCQIEFKDIDHMPPVEFILSGNKGSYFGYGIYRIVEGELFNLFGVDMEDCC